MAFISCVSSFLFFSFLRQIGSFSCVSHCFTLHLPSGLPSSFLPFSSISKWKANSVVLSEAAFEGIFHPIESQDDDDNDGTRALLSMNLGALVSNLRFFPSLPVVELCYLDLERRRSNGYTRHFFFFGATGKGVKEKEDSHPLRREGASSIRTFFCAAPEMNGSHDLWHLRLLGRSQSQSPSKMIFNNRAPLLFLQVR